MRKSKSKKLTEAQVVELLTEDIKSDDEKQDQEKKEFTANSDETSCGAPDTNEISLELKTIQNFLLWTMLINKCKHEKKKQ